MYKTSEKKFNMTIDEAKRVRIVDFLAQLGHRAQYMKSEQYWYLSPLRKEVTPSFKVNDRLNEWYDFGEATGGDLVELGKYLCETKSVSEALAYIERHVNGVNLANVCQIILDRESLGKELVLLTLKNLFVRWMKFVWK